MHNADYNWLIFPVNLQRLQVFTILKTDYNWLIFPVNLQQCYVTQNPDIIITD